MSSTMLMPPLPPPPAEEDAGLSDIGRAASARREDNGTTDNDPGGIPAKKNDPNWKERIDVSIARSRKIRGSNYIQISMIDVGAMEPR